MKSTALKLSTKTLVLGASVAFAGLGSVGTADVLDDAIVDYSGNGPSSVAASSYRTGDYQTTTLLEEDYYDWSSQNQEGLEEAEFAAFEVPEDLRVND